MVLSDSGSIQFVNSSLTDVWGFESTALRGEHISESALVADESAATFDDFPSAGRELRNHSLTVNAGDDCPVSVELAIHPLEGEGPEQLVGIFHETQEAEDAGTIQEWATMMERLPDITPLIDISCLLTPDHEFISINEEATEPYGMKPTDFHGEVCYELVHDQSRPIDACPCEEVLETGETIAGTEFQEDGRHYVAAGAPIYGDNGEIAAIAHTVQDITDRKRREQTLEQYQQAIEASDDLIVVIDTNETYLFANSTYREYYDVEDIEGKTVDEVVGSDLYQSVVHPRNEKTFQGETITYERTETFPKRGERTLAVKYTPIYNGSSVTGLIAVFRDITERKVRERELERHKAIVENSTDIATIVDPDGTISYISQAVQEMMGYDTMDLCGKQFSEIIHPGDREQFAAAIDDVLVESNASVSTQVRFRDSEGNWSWMESRMCNFTDNEDIAGILVHSRDISKRKEREHRLERQNERLDDFTSVVSHDLRNPLNVAQGRIELARNECESDHLHAVESAVSRSVEMVDDLLTLAREGRDVSDFQDVPIGEVVPNCWGNVETAEATLDLATTQVVRADSARLRQLLENLFRNAIEHGGENVTVAVGEMDGGFYVADDGQGIPSKRRERVFETGFSTAQEGTGLGLQIITNIVEAHGWEIRVTDSDAGGARFEITDVEIVDG